jgi:endonuclease YncB( thermonuclease family)
MVFIVNVMKSLYKRFKNRHTRNKSSSSSPVVVEEPMDKVVKRLYNKCNEDSIIPSEFHHLKDIEYKDTRRFIPPIEHGKVVKVYDGDTITIASTIFNYNVVYRFSVRLRRIDSPEIKGKTAEEKRLAQQSREALHNLIFGKIVFLTNVDTDKYGRILADVILYYDIDNPNNPTLIPINISDWMLENGLAVPYDGGKKIRPKEWSKEDGEGEDPLQN